MGRISSVEQLPPDILRQLQALLLDPRCTQLDVTRRINRILAGHDLPKVSKSAVNRYAQTFKEMTAELVETDRMASLMMAELKISNQSEIGQVTAELLRVMIMQFMPLVRGAMAEEDLSVKEMKLVVDMIKGLTASQQQLEQSATLNEKRQRDMESAIFAARLAVLKELSAYINKNFPDLNKSFAAVLTPFADFLAHGKN